MARAAQVMPLRLARRMCLSCGFDGRAIQNHSRDNEWVCPCCGSDLYARPPKSYAELEALSDSNPGVPLDEELFVDAPRRSISELVHLGLTARPRLFPLLLGLAAAIALFGLGVWLGRIV